MVMNWIHQRGGEDDYFVMEFCCQWSRNTAFGKWWNLIVICEWEP